MSDASLIPSPCMLYAVLLHAAEFAVDDVIAAVVPVGTVSAHVTRLRAGIRTLTRLLIHGAAHLLEQFVQLFGLCLQCIGIGSLDHALQFVGFVLDLGLQIMIAKGKRNEAVRAAIVRNGALYLAAIGGAGALLSKCILSADVIAYEDLGPEAVRKLTVKDFPAIVAIDTEGESIYRY